MGGVDQNLVICQWRALDRLRQIIDLRDNDKSPYFAITEFNNCYHSVTEFAFLINIFGKLPFSRKSDRKKQNIVCSQTQLDDIAHEQTIICRQLFAGHMVGSLPMKRKKNIYDNYYGQCSLMKFVWSTRSSWAPVMISGTHYFTCMSETKY